MGILISSLFLVLAALGTPVSGQAAQTAKSSEEVAGLVVPDKAVCRVCAARSTHGSDPEPEDVAGVSVHDGKLYAFCSDECKNEFDASPDWWAEMELPFAVPGLTVRDLQGEVVPLAVGDGRFTVLDFWATWCQPCRKTMRELQARFEHGDESLRIIGVSTDDGDRALRKVQRTVKSQGIGYPIVLDDQQPAAWATLKIYAVPTIMLIDPEGSVVWRFTGPDGDDRLEEALERFGAKATSPSP